MGAIEQYIDFCSCRSFFVCLLHHYLTANNPARILSFLYEDRVFLMISLAIRIRLGEVGQVYCIRDPAAVSVRTIFIQ